MYAVRIHYVSPSPTTARADESYQYYITTVIITHKSEVLGNPIIRSTVRIRSSYSTTEFFMMHDSFVPEFSARDALLSTLSTLTVTGNQILHQSYGSCFQGLRKYHGGDSSSNRLCWNGR